jgi:hypothetical protein
MEQWRPAAGTLAVVSILDLRSIATRSHWVDLQDLGVRDRCQCVDGVCCKAFGMPYVTYYFPIWVYDSPGSVEGGFFVWGVTPTQYKNLINVAQAGNLLQFDLQVQVTQQGQGLQTSFTIMPSSQLRSMMGEEMKADLDKSVKGFFESESQLCKPMTEAGYSQLLMQAGYDFQSGLPLPKRQQAQMGFYPQGIPQSGYGYQPQQLGYTPSQTPQMPAPQAPSSPPPAFQQGSSQVVEASVEVVPTPAQNAGPVQGQPQQAVPAPQTQPQPTPPVQQYQPATQGEVNSAPPTSPITPEELQSMLGD